MRASERIALVLGLALCAVAAAQGGPAGDAGLSEADVYRREVFQYQAGGRPDPFQPLLSGDEIGVRVQDLTLEGIVYTPTPGGSVAIFSITGTPGRTRLRVGQRLGSVTVTAVHPRRVDLREDQFGVSRGYTLELQRRAQPVGEPPAPPAAVPAQPAPPAGGRP